MDDNRPEGNQAGSYPLSGRKRALYRALESKDERLGAMYAGALDTLGNIENPDRFAQAAHSLRELMEKLPQYLNVPLPRKSATLKVQVRQLAERWEDVKQSRRVLGNDSPTGEEPAGRAFEHAEYATCLQGFLVELERFFDEFREEHLVRKERVSRVLRKLEPLRAFHLPDPVERLRIQRWSDCHEYFELVAHHGSFDEAGFYARLSNLETFLLDQFRPAPYADRAEIDEAIAAAEKEMTPDAVGAALATIKRAVDYAYFFDHLQAPGWIGPLRREGFFQSPPSPLEEGGYVSFPSWPEARYLIRMAALAPEQTLAAVREIQPTDNARVHQDVVEIALAMPPGLTAKLVGKIAEWVQSGYGLLLPDQAGELAVKLAQTHHKRAALALTRALLTTRPDQRVDPNSELARYHTPEPQPLYSDWQYKSILKEQVPALVEALGIDALRLLSELLDTAVSQSLHSDGGVDGQDFSYIRRPAIETHPQNMGHGVLDYLVSSVRNAAEQLAESDPTLIPQIVQLFEEKPWQVFTRLALHLLRKFHASAPELVAKYLRSRELFDEPGVRHEYFLLEQECFFGLPQEDKDTILGWVEAGPDLAGVRAYYEDLHCEGQLNATSVDEMVAQYADHWRRNRLAPIVEYLSPRWRERYNAFVAALGEPEHPDFVSYLTAGDWAPNSPKTPEELQAMDTQEVVSFLNGWQAPGDHEGPSVEGLAETFAGAVASDPLRFAAEAERFAGVRPKYQWRMLEVLAPRVRELETFPWSPVLALCAQIIEQRYKGGDEIADAAEGHFPGMRKHAQNLLPYAIVPLILRGLEPVGTRIPLDLRSVVWQILEPMLGDPEPSLRQLALRAALSYASWAASPVHSSEGDNQQPPPVGFGAVPEVRKVLDEHLDPAFDSALEVRAFYGEYFPWIARFDASWGTENLSRVFPEAEAQHELWRTAWEAYVQHNGPGRWSYSLLGRQYRQAIDDLLLEAPVEGKRDVREPEKRLAEHLMTLYWWGDIGFAESEVGGSLLRHFFECAPEPVRAYALDYLGRSLSFTTDGIDPPLLERLKVLWDWRLRTARAGVNTNQEGEREIAAFWEWFISDRFDPIWAIEQLKEVLKLVNELPFAYAVVEKLAKLSALSPDLHAGALDCIGLLIEGYRNAPVTRLYAPGWLWEAWPILSAAVASGDPKLVEHGTHLKNLMAALGFEPPAG